MWRRGSGVSNGQGGRAEIGRRSVEWVRLFEVDPDLLSRTPPQLREKLRRVTVPVWRVAPGPWDPRVGEEEALLTFFILEGLLYRSIRVYGRRVVELLGPGDTLRPTEDTGWTMLHYEPSWQVAAPSRIAVLGQGFEGLEIGVLGQLQGRTEHARRILIHQMGIALSPIRPLAARVLAMLWYLSDRWGRKRRGEVVLELPLTHQVIADLLGAHRQSVTVSCRELRERGLARQDGERLWRLYGDPPTTLERLEALFADETIAAGLEGGGAGKA